MCAFSFLVFAAIISQQSQAAVLPAMRVVDLDGDGWLDQLRLGEDGALAVALNRGQRSFEVVQSSLPGTAVQDVLVGDLDGDGNADLYLVSRGANIALVGDGTGRFVESTSDLGLADLGFGLSAERVDLDGDGLAELLLHNRTSDVIFWAIPEGGFERDSAVPATPVVGIRSALDEPDGTTIEDAPGPAATPPKGERAPVRGRFLDTVPRPGNVGGREEANPQPNIGNVELIPGGGGCANSVRDATTKVCVRVDKTPTIGRILPLGPEFFVSPGGNVGINELAPVSRLEVNGDFQALGDFIPGRPALENTADDTLTLAAHTGSSAPLTFDLREDSSTISNLNAYGMLELTRTNADMDGSGTAIYFRMPRNNGSIFEYAGIGTRIESGLSANVSPQGALDLYTSENGTARKLSVTVSGPGNVGIGTIAPSEKLHVNGDARADGAFLVSGTEDAVHRGTSGRYGQATSFTFDGTPGVMIEGGTSESGGFFANGNVAAIWSPGDADVLRVYDEDHFLGGAVEPVFTVTTGGDVEQRLSDSGLVKAACHIDGTQNPPVVSRSFNNLPNGSAVTVSDLGAGAYEIDFGDDDLSGRFFFGTLGDAGQGSPNSRGGLDVNLRVGNPTALFVQTFTSSGGGVDNEFYVVVL